MMTAAEVDVSSDGLLSDEELNVLTITQLKALAAELGYTVTKRTKADIIEEILDQQEYTITYTLDGGTVATANPTKYTRATAAFTLNNPTKEGYTFAGWTGTGLEEATETVTIAKGSTGARSYTATWTEVVETPEEEPQSEEPQNP